MMLQTIAQKKLSKVEKDTGNMIGDVINNNYKTVTLNIGTVGRCLQRGLPNNLKIDEFTVDDYSKVHEHILSSIQDMVKINTDLIRCGCLATFHYINTIMAEHPSIDLGSDDIKARRDKLRYIVNEKEGYFRTLVKGLYNGVTKIKGKGGSFESAKETVELFMCIPGDNDGIIKRIRGYMSNAAPTSFLEQVGQTLENMVRCHIFKYVSELKNRVCTPFVSFIYNSIKHKCCTPHILTTLSAYVHYLELYLESRLGKESGRGSIPRFNRREGQIFDP